MRWTGRWRRRRRDGARRRNAPVGSEPADDPTEPVFKDQRPADDEVPEKEDEGPGRPPEAVVVAADADEEDTEAARRQGRDARARETLPANAAGGNIKRNDFSSSRVPRENLLIDEKFRDELIAEGDERVAAAKEVLAQGDAVHRLLGAKIKKECWDTMATHGSGRAGFKDTDLVVYNSAGRG